MDGLKEWVRQLVLLVLVASCLEMLLPVNSMKKYVRMAMGLLVMLAITRPILGFLGQPVAVDEKLFAAPNGSNLPSLNEIMAKAAEFREKNLSLVTEEVQAAVDAEAAKAVAEVRGVAGATARVDLYVVDGDQRIRNVAVTIRPGLEGTVLPVEPVQPVRPVNPGGQAAPGPAAGAGQAATAREPLPGEQELAAAVRRAVAQRFGIADDPRLIQVLVESKGGKQP